MNSDFFFNYTSADINLCNRVSSINTLFSYYVNKTIVITFADFLLKETGDEKARAKSAPEPHIPVKPNALYTHTHASHIFSTHRAHVAFPVNVLSGRQRQWPRRYGGGFGGGSEGIAVTRRQGRMVVTRTGHCHPLAIADTTPPSPMQNHPLSRSMGNYFLSVDYGVNFRTTRPRSFRTRYSDSRRLRKRVSYEHCGKRFLIRYVWFNNNETNNNYLIKEINPFCFILLMSRLLK